MIKKLTLILALLIGAAHAQSVRPYVEGNIGAPINMGYNFLAEGRTGVEIQNRHFFSMFETAVALAPKVETGNGFHIRELGELFLKVPAGYSVGGGVEWSKQFTSAFNKSSYHPFVGVGKTTKWGSFLGEYILQGTDKTNHVQGVFTTTEYTVTYHISLVGEVGVFHYNTTNRPETHMGGTASAGVKYRF